MWAENHCEMRTWWVENQVSQYPLWTRTRLAENHRVENQVSSDQVSQAPGEPRTTKPRTRWVEKQLSWEPGNFKTMMSREPGELRTRWVKKESVCQHHVIIHHREQLHGVLVKCTRHHRHHHHHFIYSIYQICIKYGLKSDLKTTSLICTQCLMTLKRHEFELLLPSVGWWLVGWCLMTFSAQKGYIVPTKVCYRYYFQINTLFRVLVKNMRAQKLWQDDRDEDEQLKNNIN